MRILIADDEPMSRRLLQATLTRLGHDVLAVNDGLEARAALRQGDGPRLAILDWMMPGLDGLAVCRAVRSQADHYVYIILLTARSGREDMMAGFGAEADDFLTKPFDAVELSARITSGARVLDLQARLIAAQEALRHEATHDRLTSLRNRGTILDLLVHELERSRRANSPLGVAVVDIDHFKSINDAHGHAAGDLVLRETAERMAGVLRQIDAIGRCGGEEFLVVLPDCDEPSLRAIGERIRSAVCGRPMVAGGTSIDVSISVGMTRRSAHTDDVASLIKAADRALYGAKDQGRNRVWIAGTSDDAAPPRAATIVAGQAPGPGPAFHITA